MTQTSTILTEYRNLKVVGGDGNGSLIEGENQVSINGKHYGGWCKFQGHTQLMRIRAVMDADSKAAYEIAKLSNGFGPDTPELAMADWSGIRDSSPDSKMLMDAFAQGWWINHNDTKPWPWEAAMRADGFFYLEPAKAEKMTPARMLAISEDVLEALRSVGAKHGVRFKIPKTTRHEYHLNMDLRAVTNAPTTGRKS